MWSRIISCAFSVLPIFWPPLSWLAAADAMQSLQRLTFESNHGSEGQEAVSSALQTLSSQLATCCFLPQLDIPNHRISRNVSLQRERARLFKFALCFFGSSPGNFKNELGFCSVFHYLYGCNYPFSWKKNLIHQYLFWGMALGAS